MKIKHTPGPLCVEKSLENDRLQSWHYAVRTTGKMPDTPWSPRYVAWMCGMLSESVSRISPPFGRCEKCGNIVLRYRHAQDGVDIRTDPEIESDAELIARFPEVPHECSDQGCPGDLNRRKLEMWGEMLAALDGTKQLLLECGWAISARPIKQGTYEALKRVIAKAKELK